MPVSDCSSLDQLTASINKLAESDLNALASKDGYDIARARTLKSLAKLQQKLETPLELSRRLGWQEPSRIASIKIALDKGLFDVLKSHGCDVGVSAQDLAKETGANEELVSRIMRQLASWDTVRETGLNRYAANATSLAFLDPKVSSGIDYWLDISSKGFASLPHFLRENSFETLAVPGKGNWERATGGTKGFFRWFEDHPEALGPFMAHMDGFTDGRTKWTSMYPAGDRLLLDADSTGPLIVDIGGGVGQDMATFQQVYPQKLGRLHVQDTQHVVTEAKKRSGDPAIELHAYDFFTPQPITGARAYFLHYVLHDWPDEAALKILGHIRDAMRKEYSKLLVTELVLADENPEPFNTALDMVMMTVFGSKERTEQDWRNLLGRAGLEVVGIWSLPGDRESVMEVVRV